MIKKESIFRTILGDKESNQIIELFDRLTKDHLLEWARGILINQLYKEKILDSICHNLNFLDSPEYYDILAEELTYEFGNPKAISVLFVQEFLPLVANILREKRGRRDVIHSPIERILSLLALKTPITEISEETAASEHYINLLKKDYTLFERFISRWEVKDEKELRDKSQHCDLSLERLFVFWSFYTRLQEDKRFLLYIEVDRLIEKGKLRIERKVFFNLLMALHDLNGLIRQEIIQILTGRAGEFEIQVSDYTQLDHYGLLSGKSKREIKTLLNRLVDLRVISMSSYRVYLTTTGLELFMRVFLDEFIYSLEQILASKEADKLKKAEYLFLRLHPTVKEQIIEEMTRRRNLAFLDVLYAVEDKLDSNLREKAIRDYSLLRDSRSTKLLLRMLKQGHVEDRVQACHLLGQVGDSHALTALTILGINDHQEEEVKLAAIAGLVELKDQQAIPYLTKLAANNQSKVKEAAKKAVALLKKQGAKK